MVIPILAYMCLYGHSEGVNERAYVPKRYRNSGYRRMINASWRFITNIGAKILNHAESITTSHRQRSTTRVNLRRRTCKERLLLSACAALACQAQKTHWEHRVSFDTDSFDIGIDNRCSACISGTPEDFIGPLRDSTRTIKGFMGAKTTNVKVGTLSWKWLDDDGKPHHFDIPNSYYVPNCNVRLLSPQHWAKSMKDHKPIEGTGCTTTSTSIELWWQQRKYKLTVPLSKITNVAAFKSAPGVHKYINFCSEASISFENEDTHPTLATEETLMQEDEQSVPPSKPTSSPGGSSSNPVRLQFDMLNGRTRIASPAFSDEIMSSHEAELLQHHRDFGHISFSKLLMAKSGIIPSRLAACPIPTCSACLTGMMTRCRWRDKSRTNFDHHIDLKPGDLTSVDMMVSPNPGLIAQMASLLTRKRYRHATVHADQASRLGFVYLQTDSTVESTVKGKEAYERFAQSHGVTIRGYHADNGIFRAKGWVKHCNDNRQALTFAAVNAHHQNGLAERRIRQLQDQARTSMIFAMSRWPKCATTALWPYALLMANETCNIAPPLQHPLRLSPLQAFSNSNIHISHKHYKPFGCPVYVLDPDLQNSNPCHKWKPRSRPGVYLGHSPLHNRNVALVLNIDTGRVSPQFHVKFDRRFHTVIQHPIESHWQDKAGFTHEELSKPPSRKRNRTNNNTNADNIQHKSQNVHTSKGTTNRSCPARPKRQTSESTDRYADNPHCKCNRLSSHIPQDCDKSSARSHEPRNRGLNAIANEIHMFDTTIREVASAPNDVPGEIFSYSSLHDSSWNLGDIDPILAYKATSNPDTLYHHQAMRQPDREEFKLAMDKEIRDQMNNGNFTVMRRKDVPQDAQMLPTVWQMKRKREIATGKILKHKARLNVDGSKMRKGIHCNETYSPVANWSSVRLLLTLVAALDWHSVQIDYVQAFPQAPVEKPLYLKIPVGFRMSKGDPKDYALRVDRNVHGQRQASRIWHKHLVNILTTKLNFMQSKHDECIFYRGNTVCLLCTDDSILAGPNKSEIESIIAEIKQSELNITVLGDIKDFLGVNITKEPSGRVHVSQPHLIK